jgi:magnesium transporter
MSDSTTALSISSLRLAEGFFLLYPEEFSREVEKTSPPAILNMLSQFPPELSPGLLNHLQPEYAADLIRIMDDAMLASVAARMDPARFALALSRIAASKRKTIIDSLAEGIKPAIEEALAYPADSAGALMATQILSFLETMTVGEAVDRLKKYKKRRLHDIYVVDKNGKLTGHASWQDLALADTEDSLEAICSEVVGSVRNVDPREEVINLLEKTRQYSVPVVDFEGKLLGIIRHGSLFDATRQEAFEDLQTMVGVSSEERALSSPWFSVRKRLPWLQVNLITAFMAASVVGFFEGTIAQVTALAVLLPVVAGQSGNTGAQALAVTIRGLTLREIRVGQWFQVARKEFIAGFLNGVAVAFVTGIGVLIWSKSWGLTGVICLSMVISMAIAGLSGAAIPVMLKALKQDPAQSSSIVLTTVTDIVGFFSFLGFATLFMEFLPKG